MFAVALTKATVSLYQRIFLWVSLDTENAIECVSLLGKPQRLSLLAVPIGAVSILQSCPLLHMNEWLNWQAYLHQDSSLDDSIHTHTKNLIDKLQEVKGNMERGWRENTNNNLSVL